MSPFLIRYARLFDVRTLKAVLLVSSGNTIATLLTFLSAPILSRLYSPSDYGALALFMMISAIISSASTLQIHNGIITEHTENGANRLVSVCFILAIVVSLLMFPISLLFTSIAGVGGWILWLAPSIALSGFSTTANAYATRNSAYRILSAMPLVAALISIPVSMLAAFADLGHHGLFLGLASSQISTAAVGTTYVLLGKRIGINHAAHIYETLARQKKYIFWSFPAGLLDKLNRELPVFLLANIADLGLLGSYNRSRQLLGLPTTLLGSAIGQVFFQNASEQFRLNGNCLTLWKKTFFALLAVSLSGMTVLIIWAPTVFSVVLGPQWAQAGEVAQILAPMMAAGFVCSPLANMFFIAGSQREDFVLLSATCAALIVLGGLGIMMQTDALGVIAIFSGVYTISYFVYAYRSYKLSKGV